MIKLKIVQDDSKEVAKVVIIDKDKVLMLKRSDYTDKYSGEWDLPGGHIKLGESIDTGMKREVEEETGLKIKNPIFIQKQGNLSFFYCLYDNMPIKLSHEHVGFEFFDKKDLDYRKKFEKVALLALEMEND